MAKVAGVAPGMVAVVMLIFPPPVSVPLLSKVSVVASAAVLPANLIQAQRDYFGAHTYKRTDKEGVFHTEWLD